MPLFTRQTEANLPTFKSLRAETTKRVKSAPLSHYSLSRDHHILQAIVTDTFGVNTLTAPSLPSSLATHSYSEGHMSHSSLLLSSWWRGFLFWPDIFYCLKLCHSCQGSICFCDAVVVVELFLDGLALLSVKLVQGSYTSSARTFSLHSSGPTKLGVSDVL